jgi:hypothetical protein
LSQASRISCNASGERIENKNMRQS